MSAKTPSQTSHTSPSYGTAVNADTLTVNVVSGNHRSAPMATDFDAFPIAPTDSTLTIA